MARVSTISLFLDDDLQSELELALMAPAVMLVKARLGDTCVSVVLNRDSVGELIETLGAFLRLMEG